ncbi:hypothetical protein FGO68_gene10824 [Halteria grandinella]|uniref:Uncharacterized protein n=1 Tax=Halteria grandinella TaxID=5974 RepID=A0A8J8NT20_HALGN|nr:hypothetical protein FGO68_gene10824 [Halteria grandinella]
MKVTLSLESGLSSVLRLYSHPVKFKQPISIVIKHNLVDEDSAEDLFFQLKQVIQAKRLKVQEIDLTISEKSMPQSSLEALINYFPSIPQLKLHLSELPVDFTLQFQRCRLLILSFSLDNLPGQIPPLEADHIQLSIAKQKLFYSKALTLLQPRISILFQKGSISLKKLISLLKKPELFGGPSMKKFVIHNVKKGASSYYDVQFAMLKYHNIVFVEPTSVPKEYADYLLDNYKVVFNTSKNTHEEYLIKEIGLKGVFKSKELIQFNINPNSGSLISNTELLWQSGWALNISTVQERSKVQHLIISFEKVWAYTQFIEALVRGFPELESLVIKFSNLEDYSNIKMRVDLLPKNFLQNLESLSIYHTHSNAHYAIPPVALFCASLIRHCPILQSLTIGRSQIPISYPYYVDKFLPIYLNSIKECSQLSSISLTQRTGNQETLKPDYGSLEDLLCPLFHPTIKSVKLSLNLNEVYQLSFLLIGRKLSCNLEHIYIDLYQGNPKHNGQALFEVAKSLKLAQQIVFETNAFIMQEYIEMFLEHCPQVQLVCNIEKVSSKSSKREWKEVCKTMSQYAAKLQEK